MAKCYYCNRELTNENNCLEHIIPNILRGKLKSKSILCKECNNGLSGIDKTLADNFMLFNVILNGKTDRPINIKVPVKINGEEARLMLGMQYSSKFKPEIIKTDNHKKFSFRGIFASNDKEEKKKFLKNVQKCLKNNKKELSLNEIEKYCKTTESIPQIEHKSTLNLNDIILGYLKIALGFCSYKNKIQYVQQEIFTHFKNFNLDNFKKFIRLIENNKFKNGKLCHHIYLIGDKENSKLFCVISIFNSIEIAIILNDNYQNESFQENYIFDLIYSKEIQEYIHFSFDEIKDNKFDFNKIRENSISDTQYIMNFFIYRDISDVPNMLLDLLHYIYFTNVNVLKKEELKCFIKNAFAKAMDKQFYNFNLYQIEKIPEIFNQDNLYNFYKQKHLQLNQFFSSHKIKPYLELLETQLKKSQSEIRILITQNQIVDNIWTKILNEK